VAKFHVDLRKAADNAGEEGRLQTVGAHQNSIDFTLADKRVDVVLGNRTSIKNGGCIICQESDLAGYVVGVYRIDRFSSSNGGDGFVDEKTTGNVDIETEQGLNLFVQVWKVKTNDRDDRVF